MKVLQLFTALLLLVSVPALAEDRPRIMLQTTEGRIVFELDSVRAPTSVENFVDYVESGFYNDTLFHRVIDGFMVQGGGFNADFMKKQTKSPIRNEANNGLKNKAYTVAMARTNSPHSATSQFFINTVDNVSLDHVSPDNRGWGYAVFGRVIDGFDVVDKISSVATGSQGPFRQDVPKESIFIKSATLMTSATISEAEPVIKSEDILPTDGSATVGDAANDAVNGNVTNKAN